MGSFGKGIKPADRSQKCADREQRNTRVLGNIYESALSRGKTTARPRGTYFKARQSPNGKASNVVGEQNV